MNNYSFIESNTNDSYAMNNPQVGTSQPQLRPNKSRIALLRGEDVKIDRSLLNECPAKKSFSYLSCVTQSPLSSKAVKRCDLPPYLKRRSDELESGSQEENLCSRRLLSQNFGSLFKAHKIGNVAFASFKLTFKSSHPSSTRME